MLPIIGLLVGVVIGFFALPVDIPSAYSTYVAVAILAALDTVFGGLAATIQSKFDLKVFLSGFFGNTLLAAGLTYVGDQLNMQLWLAAVFVFGARLITNFAMIRRYIVNLFSRKDIEIVEVDTAVLHDSSLEKEKNKTKNKHLVRKISRRTRRKVAAARRR